MPSITPTEKGTAVPSAMAEDSEKGQLVDSHADLGLKFLAENGVVEYTEEEASKVRWKIDLFLMPIVCMTQSLDPRTALLIVER